MIEAGEERLEIEQETIREAAQYVASHTTINGIPLNDAIPEAIDHMRSHVNLHEKEDVLKLFGLVSYAGISFNGKTELV
jgi:hypothetical protein